MKCPKCGSYNKSEYVKCYICGAVLSDRQNKNAQSTSQLWNVDEFDDSVSNEKNSANIAPHNHAETYINKKNINFGDIEIEQEPEQEPKPRKKRFNTKKIQRAQKGIWGHEGTNRSNFIGRKRSDVPIIALDDEIDKEPDESTSKGRKRRTTSVNVSKIERYQGQEVNVIVPPKKEEKKKPSIVRHRQKKLKKLRWGRLLLVSVMAAAVIFLCVIGLYYLIKGISSGFSALFEPRNPIENDGEPLVERVMKDNKVWHKITFFGENGDRILVEDTSHELKRNLTIHDSKAVLMLDDYSYIPKPDEEYYTEPFAYIDLIASHFDKDGVETVLNVPIYRISIPLAPLTIIHPVEQSLTFNKTQVMVKVKVNKGSRVIIGIKNMKNMTGNIDDDGYVKTYINLEPKGENKIRIIVEADGYRINEYFLKVINPTRDIEIKLIDAKTEERNDEVLINGITEPGTTITTDATLTIDEINVKNDGSFYIRVLLSEFGWNDINLFARASDGRTATLTHSIKRIPFEGKYTSNVWQLDYKDLVATANSKIDKKYKLTGYVIERIEDPEYNLYLYNTGTASEPELLVIEYDGLYTLKTDLLYDGYGNVTGKYGNYPRLYVWYIYENEEAKQAKEAAENAEGSQETNSDSNDEG